MTATPSFVTSLSLSYLRHTQLFLVTSAYLCGQVLAVWGWRGFLLWLIGLTVCICGLWWRHDKQFVWIAGCVLLTFILGNLSLQHVLYPHFPLHHLRHLSLPQQVTIEGWLFREPERSSHRGRFYVETLRIWENGESRPASGKILLTLRSLARPWHYGDVIRAPLSLREPRNFQTPGSFDYEGYLARHGIYLTAFLWNDTSIEKIGTMGNVLRHRIEHLRQTIGTFFSAHLAPEPAAVLRALIVGDETRIDKAQREAFARAGVAHILSISGLHISLVAATAYGFWWWVLGRSRVLLLTLPLPKLASLLTCLPVLLYAVLAGGSVATWRAVIMVFAYLLARLLDRQEEIYRSLTFAALLISVVWPGALLDISFQLSFMSVLSLLLGLERFALWWAKFTASAPNDQSALSKRFLWWGMSLLVTSFSTLLGTAPLTASHFNQVAIMGLLANMFVVPLLGSAAVVLGLLSVGAIFLYEPFGVLLVVVAGHVTYAGILLTAWFAAFPYAALWVVTPTVTELVLLYALLASLFLRIPLLGAWGPSANRYLRMMFLVALLIDAGAWVWHRHLHQDLRVTFLDVGQGDAAVVELPGPQVMVIDGGGFASESFDTGEAIIAPFLWSQKITRVDVLVMSHPQLDHYGGLSYITQHFLPRELWFNGEMGHGDRFSQFLTALTQNDVKLRSLCREAPQFLLSSIVVQVLHPPCQPRGLDPNNASLVLRLSHKNIDVLFTGDIENEGETLLLSTPATIASEIVKVPHHGSRTSSSLAFVQATSPQVAIASLGANNRFRFPAPEVEQRYRQRGAQWFRTDQVGAVTISSDGDRYLLFPFRPAP